MTSPWVWKSSAALITGVLAIFAGALLLPDTGGDTGEALRLVREQDGRWLGVGVMFFGGGLGLLMGLPACLSLFPGRGRTIGGIGALIMAVAAVATAGYAMLVVFFRAVVLADAVRPAAFDAVVDDPALSGLLLTWVASFYVGELLIALAVLRARTAPRWIPASLIVHVVLWPVTLVMPAGLAGFTVVFAVLGFCGLAIAAVAEEQRTTVLHTPSTHPAVGGVTTSWNRGALDRTSRLGG